MHNNKKVKSRKHAFKTYKNFLRKFRSSSSCVFLNVKSPSFVQLRFPKRIVYALGYREQT
ncbi:hypothetical protein BaRGS_00005922, partial [Batillaria attramentaria]